MSIGVFLISPGGEPYAVIVDSCNHAQNTVVTMLTAMLTASGYLSTLVIFTLHCPCSQNKLEQGCVQYGMLKDSSRGKIAPKHQKLADLVLNYEADGFFHI